MIVSNPIFNWGGGVLAADLGGAGGGISGVGTWEFQYHFLISIWLPRNHKEKVKKKKNDLSLFFK